MESEKSTIKNDDTQAYKILGSALAENTGEIYKTTLSSGKSQFIADEPLKFGGGDEGPAPTDYLCMALASCKAITMRMYAKRKTWDLVDVSVKVSFVKGTQMPSGVNTFFSSIQLTGNLNPEQKKRLLEIAKACPVDRLLIKASDVISELE